MKKGRINLFKAEPILYARGDRDTNDREHRAARAYLQSRAGKEGFTGCSLSDECQRLLLPSMETLNSSGSKDNESKCSESSRISILKSRG